MSAEVFDLVARASQQLSDLLFQNEPSMVRRNSYAHGAFSLSRSST
jgi:hypothetical protein